ncbi:hypothetical protein ACA910_012052 [Epithemia clementina (nom. ined.)]
MCSRQLKLVEVCWSWSLGHLGPCLYSSRCHGHRKPDKNSTQQTTPTKPKHLPSLILRKEKGKDAPTHVLSVRSSSGAPQIYKRRSCLILHSALT